MVVRWESCIRSMKPLLWLPLAPPIRSRRNVSLSSSMNCFVWSTPLYSKRCLMHSLSPNSSLRDENITIDSHTDEDPVFSFLPPFSSIPLVKLAKLLPDEVIEKLDNGLKNHLERFPNRYRLFRTSNGLLNVELTKGGSLQRRIKPKKKCIKEQPEYQIPHICFPLPNRFFTLESIMKAFDSLGAVDSKNVSDKEEKRILEEEFLEKANLFVRERLFPVKSIQVWLLTEEHIMDESLTTTGKEEEKGTVEEQQTEEKHGKSKLQAFRWVRIKDTEQFDNVLNQLRHEIVKKRLKNGTNMDEKVSCVKPPSAVTTRSTLYTRFITRPVMCSVVEKEKIPDDCNGIIEDYNVYRLCRALNTKTFIQFPELQDIAGDWLTQPLAAVLAIAGEESKTNIEQGVKSHGCSIFDFEYDPLDSTRVVGVRFWLDERRYLPSLYREKTLSELQEELSELKNTSPKKPKNIANHIRVRYIDKKRLLHRCIALHEIGVSPLCHPDVLAYYIFDLLPLDNQLILTGHLPKLLPDDVQRITDARVRSWLKQYPHLFRLVEHPPELFIQRVDVVSEENEGESHMNENNNKKQRKQQEQDIESQEKKNVMTGTSQYQTRYEEQLLVDPDEQLRFMVSLVASRLEVCKSRKLLPSHLPKFMTTELRRAILPRHSGGILSYLQRYPDVFILTYGVHPHEPVVTLTPRFHPNLENASQEGTEPINTVDSVKEKEE
ncbi:uncharacterized protein TM35_000082890 [Trypanosoma theileri]|uniref:Uncharacterized protein n=1 Tax=Trypanosoma theileri TaxID=67003 RepID=A0A1X0P0X8_9TRYP|nr:uncharacterized protein TM35_000082890 [Trypanosoma theileri]ORC90491.1 hypothetical protein TM35_000082890 [Trypanosoma theileri]